MLVLVVGGAASGKSEFAESIIMDGGCSRRVYIATMEIWDAESEKRVARHREMRNDKGFLTIEAPVKLETVNVPRRCAALLEDLSNLAANEFFGEDGPDGACERMLSGIDGLCRTAELTVVVSNNVFDDGRTYDDEMSKYLDCLAGLNIELARQADVVYEVVCGMPMLWKDCDGTR